MYTYVKRLQSRPEHVRKQIVIGALIVCMMFVVSLWVYELREPQEHPVTVDAAQSSPKPFALFKNSLSSALENISASVGNISFGKKAAVPEEKQINLIPIEHPEGQ